MLVLYGRNDFIQRNLLDTAQVVSLYRGLTVNQNALRTADE